MERRANTLPVDQRDLVVSLLASIMKRPRIFRISEKVLVVCKDVARDMF